MYRKFIKDSAGILVVKVGGTILAFVLSIVLARSLGSSGYGVYSYVLSLFMLLSIPLQAGVPMLAVRETSKALIDNDVALVRGGWLCVLGLSICYFVFLCLIISVVDFAYDGWSESVRYAVFIVGLISIPFGALVVSQGAIIRGFGRIVLGAVPEVLARPVLNLILILTILFCFSEYELNPYNAIVVHAVSVFVAFVLGVVILHYLTAGHEKLDRSIQKELGSWIESLYPLTIVGGVQLLFGYADVVILGVFRDDVEVGAYKIAAQLSAFVVFGLTVLNQMLHPKFARYYARNEIDKLQDLAITSSQSIFILALFPALLFLIVGENVIYLTYGNEYAAGAVAFKILVFGQLMNAAFGSVGALLNMTGHEKDSMHGMLIALSANIVLSVILIPRFGIEGAAFSTVTSMILWNVVLRHYVKIRLNIESSGLVFFLKKVMDMKVKK